MSSSYTPVASGPSSTTPPPQPRRLDWGRVAMVPVSVLLGALVLARLGKLVGGTGQSTATAAVSAVVTGALSAAFYLLIIRAYLRRGPARATTREPLALAAGPVATFLPFTLPWLGHGSSADGLLLLGDVLLAAGFGFSVWSVRCLDRSLSVVPQARSLVQRGPYSRVRHPLYLGELVAMLGLAITLGGVAPLLVWAALAALQAYRAVQEEHLLGSTLPGYAEYSARTGRIVPGVF